MVVLSDVTASNASLFTSLPSGLVAVFAGATAGIGEMTLKAFVKHTQQPKIYFIGRSQEAGDKLQQELQALNDGGQYHFIKSDMSLLKNVDEVCQRIKTKEKAINLLFLTQGSLRIFGGDTEEGLPYVTALTLYSRNRLTVNLLPLLRQAPTLRRVVSVMAGGKEGALSVDDIAGRKISMGKARGHLCTVMTLALEALARQAPEVTFIHNYPGAVDTNLIRREDGLMMLALKYVFRFTLRNRFLAPEEVGERHVWLCTTPRFPPRETRATEHGDSVALGIDGQVGSGVYSVDEKGDSAPQSVVDLLKGYEKDGAVNTVWEHIEGEFKRVTGTISI